MRCHGIVAVLLVLLAETAVREGGATLPLNKDGVEGFLTVTVAEMDASKPAEVDYRLEIHAPRNTEVKEPELIGATEAWESTPSRPQAEVDDDRKVQRFHLHLKQVKPDFESLPGVEVRFRKEGMDDFDKLTWTDILKESRGLQVPQPRIKPPEQPRSLWWLLGIAVLLFALLGVALWSFWGKKPPPPLTPAERALRELDRLEGLGLAGPDETGWYPTEISTVIRRFLSDRYGLPAQQQTTAEFLQTMRQTPELSEEQQQTVKELLERCDLAKFAALRTPPDECRRIAALARTVVQQTAGSLVEATQ